jgi:hypothetical protein
MIGEKNDQEKKKTSDLPTKETRGIENIYQTRRERNEIERRVEKKEHKRKRAKSK